MPVSLGQPKPIRSELQAGSLLIVRRSPMMAIPLVLREAVRSQVFPRPKLSCQVNTGIRTSLLRRLYRRHPVAHFPKNVPQTGRPGFDEFLELERRSCGLPAVPKPDKARLKAVDSRKWVVQRHFRKTIEFCGRPMGAPAPSRMSGCAASTKDQLLG